MGHECGPRIGSFVAKIKVNWCPETAVAALDWRKQEERCTGKMGVVWKRVALDCFVKDASHRRSITKPTLRVPTFRICRGVYSN